MNKSIILFVFSRFVILLCLWGKKKANFFVFFFSNDCTRRQEESDFFCIFLQQWLHSTEYVSWWLDFVEMISLEEHTFVRPSILLAIRFQQHVCSDHAHHLPLCVVVCCNVSKCVVCVLQCVATGIAVCCNMLQCVVVCCHNIIRDPGNSHWTIPERVPTLRPSSILAHLAHSPQFLVQVLFIDKRRTLRNLFKSSPQGP